MRLHEIEQAIPVLYHGTCEDSANHLVRHGWQPRSGPVGGNQGQSRYLYLSTDPQDALWFAQAKGCDTILAVHDVPLGALIVDPEDGIGETVADEISQPHGLPGKLALTRPLPAQHFRRYTPSGGAHSLAEHQITLEGWWINPAGTLLSCDHRHDLHHADIALDHFPPEGADDDDDYDGGDVAMKSASMSGWIYGSYIPGQILSIAWHQGGGFHQAPSRAAKRTLLAWLREHGPLFPKIEVHIDDHATQIFDQTKSAIGFVQRTLKA